MGRQVPGGREEGGNVKSFRIIVTLLALASPLRSPRNDCADSPERGQAKTWVIIVLLAAVLLAVLLAVAGPTLALLWSQVWERFG